MVSPENEQSFPLSRLINLRRARGKHPKQERENMTLEITKREKKGIKLIAYECDTHAQASALYMQFLQKFRLGASKGSNCRIVETGETVAYNGTIWDTQGKRVYSPYA